MNLSFRHWLDNGIRVVGEPIPAMRSVSIGVWIGTGSRNETIANNGISHFLEHMLFKGTARYTARDLALVFDSIGGQVNAFTSKEYTCYHAKVLDEHFTTALDTLSDMLFHSQFAPQEIDKERNVVIEEIRMCEDQPDELVMDIISESVYSGHPLGYTILGLEQNLRSFTRDNIQSYINERYRPENIVISLAGNIEEASALESVRRYFGKSIPYSAESECTIDAPLFHRESSVRYKDTEQVHICLAAPGIPAGHSDLYGLILLNNALGSSSSSRLFQEIRENRGLAYSVFSFHSSYRDCGMFGMYAGTSPDNVDEVLDLIREICVDTAQSGLSEDELEKCKQQVKGSMMLSLESTTSRMSRLGKNELVLGREVTLDETIENINAVTTADISRIAANIVGEKYAIAAVGPVKPDQFDRYLS